MCWGNRSKCRRNSSNSESAMIFGYNQKQQLKKWIRQIIMCILTTTTRFYRIRLFTEQSLDRISFRCVYIYGRLWGAGSCRILYTCQREYVERGVAVAELVPRIAHAHGAVGVPVGWHSLSEPEKKCVPRPWRYWFFPKFLSQVNLCSSSCVFLIKTQHARRGSINLRNGHL